MNQSTLTILAPSPTRPKRPDVKEGVKEVGGLLDDLFERGEAVAREPAEGPPESPEVATPDRLRVMRDEMAQLLRDGTIHYMSVFYLDGVDDDRAGWSDGHVALEIHTDESAAQMRRRLARDAPRLLEKLFSGCTDFKAANQRERRRFLARYTRRPDVYFVAFPGRSVAQIRAEQDLRTRARNAFQSALRGHPPKLDVEKLAKSAPLQAPSSASAMWEYLRTNESVKPILPGPARPFAVRWNMRNGGLLVRANLWAWRIWWGLVVSSALLWMATAPRLHSIELLALTFAAVALVVLVLWWREAPRTLSPAGAARVLASGLEVWLTRAATGAVVLAAGAVVVDTMVSIARSWPASATALVSALAGWIAVTLILRRLGFAATIPATLVLVVCDVCHFLSALDVPWLIFWAFIGLTSLPAILANLALVYVLDGATIGWTTTLVTTIAAGFWVRCMVSARGVAPHLAGTAAMGLVTLGLLLVVSACRIVCWRRLVRLAEEKENRAEPPAMPRASHLMEVEEREDRTLQNHLVTVSRVKDDPLRIRTLRRVLRAVNLLVKVYFNQGDLGGIRTIHFAQFLILEKPNRLLFLSNYDAGFGSYLQEFNSVRGVTAVWSNCVGFPPSFGLIREGAEDEQRFRQFGRHDQVPTLGWFSAYPRLFVRDIVTATETRENLQRRLDDPSTLSGQLRAIFGEPLSEADCDASLQRL